jgi:putative transposase
MSQATSPSTGKPYGLARLCRVWGVARSTLYWKRRASSAPGARRGPVGPCADDELVDHIRRILAKPRQHILSTSAELTGS